MISFRHQPHIMMLDKGKTHTEESIYESKVYARVLCSLLTFLFWFLSDRCCYANVFVIVCAHTQHAHAKSFNAYIILLELNKLLFFGGFKFNSFSPMPKEQ